MSLTAWLLAAVMTAVMILCFAEVASRFRIAGGAYLFTQAAFGRYVGLQIGWLAYVSRTTAGAVQANLFTTYLAEFVPWAGTRVGSIVVITVFIGFLAAVNLRSVLSGAQLSNVFATVKMTALIAFGALGLFWLAGHGSAGASGSDVTAGSWLQMLLLLMFAFGGFESALMPLAEAKDPQRDAPFALLVGLALVTLVYVAAQLAVLATLSDPGATNRPLAASARVMLGAGGAAAISVAALISVYGWLSSNMLAVPRLTMAMAQQRDLPALFGKVHPTWRTPWVSILIYAGISWLLAVQATLLQNMTLSSVVRLFVYGLVCAALPVLRSKESRAGVGPARFRAPAGVTLAVISVGLSLLLATRMSWREAITLGVTLALGTLHWLAVRNSANAAPATQS